MRSGTLLGGGGGGGGGVDHVCLEESNMREASRVLRGREGKK